jgi:hypothetical protein
LSLSRSFPREPETRATATAAWVLGPRFRGGERKFWVPAYAGTSGKRVRFACHQLGNRSALEWVLDQHKEKTPKDPTIREKFNTYRFADHKEKVIDLLRRVARVSVETMAIVGAMKAAKR